MIMNLEQVTYYDLQEIKRLQPDKWPDIVPDFEFYIKSVYCSPVKVIL
jgi:hypothetical protein